MLRFQAASTHDQILTHFSSRVAGGKINRNVSELLKTQNLIQAFKVKYRDAYSFLFNRKQVLADVAKWFEKETGIKLAARDNVFKLAMEDAYTPARAFSIITDSLTDMEHNVIGGAFIDVFKPIKKNEYESFMGYLGMVHGLDRLKIGKDSFGPNYTQESIEMVVRETEALHPHFKETSSNLYSWWDQFMKAYAVNGTPLVDVELYQNLRKIYPHWVPMLREVEQTTLVNGNQIKKGARSMSDQKNPMRKSSKHGSDAQIIDPIESMALDIVRIVTAARKWEQFDALHRNYQDYVKNSDDMEGISWLMTQEGPSFSRQSVDARNKKAQLILSLMESWEGPADVKGMLTQMISEGEFKEAADLGAEHGWDVIELIDDSIEDFITQYTPKQMESDFDKVTHIGQDGKLYRYRFNTNGEGGHVLRVVLNTDKAQTDKWLRIAKIGRQTWQKFVTAWAPTFVVTNPIRDTQGAVVQSKDTSSLAYSKAVAESLGQVLKATLKDTVTFFNEEMGDNIHTSETYDTFKRMGGDMGSIHGSERNFLKDVLFEIQHNGETGLQKSAPHMLRAGRRAIEEMSSMSEKPARLAEFKKSYERYRAQGMDAYSAKIEAYRDSMDITLEFAKNGFIMDTFAVQILPFFNVGLLSAEKFGRAHNKENFARTARRVFGWYVLPTLFSVALMGLNDEEDRDRAGEWAKDMYWLPNLDMKGMKLRIPKGHNYWVYSAAAERAIRDFAKEDPHAWDEFRGNVVQQFMPNLKPFWNSFNEIHANKSWHGGPIVNMNLSQYSDKTRQYDVTTSELAKWIANNIPAPEDSSLKSPKNVEYLIKQNFGDMGKWALSATSKNNDRNGLFELFRRRFTLDIGHTNNVSNRFYTYKGKLDDAYKDRKSNPDDPHLDKKLYKQFNKASSYMSDCKSMAKIMLDWEDLESRDRKAFYRDAERFIKTYAKHDEAFLYQLQEKQLLPLYKRGSRWKLEYDVSQPLDPAVQENISRVMNWLVIYEAEAMNKQFEEQFKDVN